MKRNRNQMQAAHLNNDLEEEMQVNPANRHNNRNPNNPRNAGAAGNPGNLGQYLNGNRNQDLGRRTVAQRTQPLFAQPEQVNALINNINKPLV